MRPELRSWLDEVLAPRPAPAGTTSREIVRRAIAFAGPPRIPYSLVEPVRSDFFELAELSRLLDRLAGEPEPGSVYRDAWGVRHEAVPGLFDRVLEHPLADLSRLDGHPLPDPAAPERLAQLEPFVARARQAQKYVVAADPVLLFERLQALVGFETLLIAPWEQRAALEALLDRLTELSVQAIGGFARLGVDAFMTWQDFGLQSQLAMSLETFRELYAPRLLRMVRSAHEAGMHFIWHCCGQILDLIPEMIAMGVDVVQLDQPRLLGHRTLAESFGGRICFWNAVDTQWASEAGRTEADWCAEVAAMTEPFGRFPGGFMARHYPQPHDIGLSRRFHDVTSRAFLAIPTPDSDA
jgi:hypothetical protein